MTRSATARRLPQQLAASWTALQARERRAVALAAAVLVLALLWWFFVAPTLALLKAAPAQRESLRAQAALMQNLKQEASTLQAQPPLAQNDAWQALQQVTQEQLGEAAMLTRAGSQAQVTLEGVPARQLAQWLVAARRDGYAATAQAQLQRNKATIPDEPARWSGTLTLVLPP